MKSLLFGVMFAAAIWAQTGDHPDSTSDRPPTRQKHERGAAGEIGSGAGNVGTGVAKGAGDVAKGAGKGAVSLATLHPVDAGVSVGRGAAAAGKDVGVGTVKGGAKIGKGVGKAIRKIL